MPIFSETITGWTGRVLTVEANVGANGVVILPRQIDPDQPVAVRYQGADTDLPITAYQVTSSKNVGGVDAIYLGAPGYGDPLIAGAEPWNGGWANLLPRSGRVLVTGTFGVLDTPQRVVDAAAILAATLTGGRRADSPDVNDEGETMAVTTQIEDVPDDASSTGVAVVDAMLRPLRRRRVRLS